MWLLFTCLVLAACAEGEHHFPHHVSVLEHIASDTTTNPSGGLSSTPFLEGKNWVEVEGIQHPTRFYVHERSSQIEKYPCQTCHTSSLEEMAAGEQTGKKAHWNIVMDHAGADVMTCTTCHSGEAMDGVQTLLGRSVSFDHSYQLCAQCHSTQAKDWVGGAHGKQLGGWAQPRVVSNCAACHDPHAPGFQTRWPARASRLIKE